MKIEINIKNRHVLVILLFIIAASAIGLVVAYNTNNPSVMGHTWGEMMCDNTLCANPVNGNVGIGTQNPTEKLEVNGFIKTSSGIKFPDGSVQESASSSGFFQSYSNKMFGTGADGDVVISANTVLPAGTGGVKVMNYNNLVINSGVNLTSNPSDKVLVILVKNKLTINGNITMNGRGGAGGIGVGGGAGAAGGGGGAGTSGGGGGGYVGGSTIVTIPFIAGTGAGGVTDGSYGYPGQSYMPSSFNTPIPFIIARYLYGGGGGDCVWSGGGGNGSGVIWIEAKEIEWGASGFVTCNGNNGGTYMGWYGAGGGGGGFCQLAYKTKTGTSRIQANGGLSGSGIYLYGGPGAAGSTGEFQVS